MDVFVADDELITIPVNSELTAVLSCRSGIVIAVKKPVADIISLCSIPQTTETLIDQLHGLGYQNVDEAEIVQCLQKLRSEKVILLDCQEHLTSHEQRSFKIPFIEKTPKIFYLNPTHMCNLQCKYCYNDTIRKSSLTSLDELTTEEWNSVIDQIVDICAESIVVTGGEPLLRPELLSVWKKAKTAGLHVTLGTNGTLITDEHDAEVIAESFSLVSLSIDSWNREDHDFCRGAGSHDKVLRAAELLSQVGAQWQGQMVISARNHGDYAHTSAYVKSKGAFRHTASFLISADDCPIDEVAGIEKGLVSTEIQSEELREVGLHRNCGAARTVASIDPYGRMFPCHLLHCPEYGTPSLRSISLTHAWFDSEGLARYRNLNYASISPCGGCKYFSLCLGGCRGIAFLKTGSASGFVGNLFCRRRKRYITQLASSKAMQWSMTRQKAGEALALPDGVDDECANDSI